MHPESFDKHFKHKEPVTEKSPAKARAPEEEKRPDPPTEAALPERISPGFTFNPDFKPTFMGNPVMSPAGIEAPSPITRSMVKEMSPLMPGFPLFPQPMAAAPAEVKPQLSGSRLYQQRKQRLHGFQVVN